MSTRTILRLLVLVSALVLAASPPAASARQGKKRPHLAVVSVKAAPGEPRPLHRF